MRQGVQTSGQENNASTKLGTYMKNTIRDVFLSRSELLLSFLLALQIWWGWVASAFMGGREAMIGDSTPLAVVVVFFYIADILASWKVHTSDTGFYSSVSVGHQSEAAKCKMAIIHFIIYTSVFALVMPLRRGVCMARRLPLWRICNLQNMSEFTSET